MRCKLSYMSITVSSSTQATNAGIFGLHWYVHVLKNISNWSQTCAVNFKYLHLNLASTVLCWFKHILFRRKGLGAAYNTTMPSPDPSTLFTHCSRSKAFSLKLSFCCTYPEAKSLAWSSCAIPLRARRTPRYERVKPLPTDELDELRFLLLLFVSSIALKIKIK